MKDKDIDISCSFVEIYNDNIRDLAESFLEVTSGDTSRINTPKDNKRTTTKKKPTLLVRESAAGNVFVEGLTQCPLNSLDEVWGILESGIAIRETSENYINKYSSRSHTIFTLRIAVKPKPNKKDTDKEQDNTIVIGNLSFVDLAGSESFSQRN